MIHVTDKTFHGFYFSVSGHEATDQMIERSDAHCACAANLQISCRQDGGAMSGPSADNLSINFIAAKALASTLHSHLDGPTRSLRDGHIIQTVMAGAVDGLRNNFVNIKS